MQLTDKLKKIFWMYGYVVFSIAFLVCALFINANVQANLQTETNTDDVAMTIKDIDVVTIENSIQRSKNGVL